MSHTKLQLISYIYDQDASPSSENFSPLCRKWLDEKFPNKSNESKDRFVKVFQSTVTKKYKAARNKHNLLNTAKNKVYFATPIFPPEEPPLTPPKKQKLDDSGLDDDDWNLYNWHEDAASQDDACCHSWFLIPVQDGVDVPAVQKVLLVYTIGSFQSRLGSLIFFKMHFWL